MKSQKKNFKLKRSGSKSQDHTQKSKSEAEIAKDLTELEKEMFSIKITDLEEKLNRKKQLCTFLEEERQFFEVEYESKKILKKESMALLNKAYEDFHLDLHLLENVLNKMEKISPGKSLKRKDTSHTTEKMERLITLEKKLEDKLHEAERNIEDISSLTSKLLELQDQISTKSENFKAEVSNLDIEFNSFVVGLQDKLTTVVEQMIEDKSLKLHLLPLPYQALFESGMLGNTWCESTLKTCEHLVKQNTEIIEQINELNRHYQEVNEAAHKAYGVILSNQARILFSNASHNLDPSVPPQKILSTARHENETHMKYLIELNNMSMLLERIIAQLERKVETLEMEIKQQETSEDNYHENSDLLHIISRAKDVIIQEL